MITIKATDEDSDDRNTKFDLRIVSINPKPHDLEFYLTQRADSQFGTISFKGCLDHEVKGLIHESNYQMSCSSWNFYLFKFRKFGQIKYV